jgi:serine/threonine protein phosphatase PrpC
MASMPELAPPTEVVAVAAGKTDVGRRRSHNEDQILVSLELGLFAVADGMGGHQAGDVASSITAASLEAFFWEERGHDVRTEGFDDVPPGARRLVEAVLHCNREVFAKSGRSAQQGGMGSTIVAMHLVAEKRRIHIAHVGDSRCYRIRDSEIELLTRDHSMINEALRLNPGLSEDILRQLPSNVVTRALGTKENVQPDVRSERFRKGDVYLLCSDGLSGEVSDEDMLFGVLESEDLEDACDLLVAMANEAGGRDNISAVLLRIEIDDDLEEEPAPEPLKVVEPDVDVEVEVEQEDDVAAEEDEELDAWLAEPDSGDQPRARSGTLPIIDEAMLDDGEDDDDEEPVARELVAEELDDEDLADAESYDGEAEPITPPTRRSDAVEEEPGVEEPEEEEPEDEAPITEEPATPDFQLDGKSVFEAFPTADVEALRALEPPYGNEPAEQPGHWSEPPESIPPDLLLPDRTSIIQGLPVLGVGHAELEEEVPASSEERRRCLSCHHKLLPEEKFCGMCGTKVPEPVVDPSIPRCDACGTEILEETRFCVECGVRL